MKYYVHELARKMQHEAVCGNQQTTLEKQGKRSEKCLFLITFQTFNQADPRASLARYNPTASFSSPHPIWFQHQELLCSQAGAAPLSKLLLFPPCFPHWVSRAPTEADCSLSLAITQPEEKTLPQHCLLKDGA